MNQSRTMRRYEVPVDDCQHDIELSWRPRDRRVLHVATVGSRHVVEFWAEHYPEAAQERHAFQVFGTGHPIPDDAQWVDTCPRTPDGLVWHLYRRGS